MKKMLKFALRRNLIFPLQLLLWNSVRDVEIFLIDYFFDYRDAIFYSLLMFLGEFIAGLIFYLYYKKIQIKSNKVKSSFVYNIGFMRSKKEAVIDSKIKINILLFFAAFLDLLVFIIFLHYDDLTIISYSLEQRLGGIFTIYLAIFYYYLLKFPIYKHQIFSLVIIGICILIIIITEFMFVEFDIFLSYTRFIVALLLIFFILFIGSLCDTIEKYLIEFDQVSPFYIIMMEGLFGTILSSIINKLYNSFNHIAEINKNLSSLESTILICSFILFIFLSGGKNLFKLATIKIYSPMASTFMDFILNPLYIIIYFFYSDEFLYKEKKNFTYFIINLIISLIVSFCGCVYNEFLILFCCGLERDTHNQVALRANIEINIGPLNYDEDFETIEENENEDSRRASELFELINLQPINK